MRFNSNYGMSAGSTGEMTMEQIQLKAPSVFAQKAHEKVSSKYSFIPTTRVIDNLGSQGWRPVWAAQSRCKNAEGKEFTKHLVRFRNASLGEIDDKCLPELVLTNSHNGLSAYKLMAGVFRMVCGNGMVVAETNFASIQIRHMGYSDSQVLEASAKVCESVPLLSGSIQRFKTIELKQDEQEAFAKSALTLRYEDGKCPFEAQKLLTPRRYDDKNNSLWHTFNRVQENMMKGGIHYIKKVEKECMGRPYIAQNRNSTRAIASVSENVKINRALWTLADEMAKIKSV